MHRKLIALDQNNTAISRQTPDHMLISKVSQSQNFYALPGNEAGGTFGPASPFAATESIAFPINNEVSGITSG